MSWLRNAWYAAAWSTEIADKPFGRTVLGEPIVFWRTDAAAVRTRRVLAKLISDEAEALGSAASSRIPDQLPQAG